MSELQHSSVGARWTDELHAHGKSCRSESYRHADARQARERCVDRDLHPAMVGVHRATCDRNGPPLLRSERPHLCARQREEIAALECGEHLLIELASSDARAMDLLSAQAYPLIVFPQRFLLDQGTVRQIREMRRDSRCNQPSPPHEP